MGAVVEGVHNMGEIFEIIKHSNSTFFKLATSIPLVADSLYYVKQEYNKVKNKNQLATYFMNGVEKSVFKATSVAYNISKTVIPYDYVDQLAFNGLKRIEAKYPLIKKPTKDVLQECSRCILSTISGVKEKKKMPKNLSEALKDRIYLIAESTSHSIGDIKFLKAMSSVAHKLLNKLEYMLDNNAKAQKKISKKSELLIDRISYLISKLNKQLKDNAKKAAEMKKEVRDVEKDLSLKDLWNIAEDWLAVLYDNLKIHQSKESLYDQSWRKFKLAVVSVILNGMILMDAVMPKIYNFTCNVYDSVTKAFVTFIKRIPHLMYKIACHCVQRIINFVRDNIKEIKQLVWTIKHISKGLWNALIKDIKHIEFELEKFFGTGSGGHSTPISDSSSEEELVCSPEKAEL